ncbi:MAG TPA: hypothetical protein TECP_00635 [Hyphomicrobiaceae bacterium MAG_BT-2024]
MLRNTILMVLSMFELRKVHARSNPGSLDKNDQFVLFIRWFAWSTIALMATYLLSCYLSYWRGWPTALSLFRDTEADILVFVQGALYIVAVIIATIFVIRTSDKCTLQSDSAVLNDISSFITRAAFWSVLFVGCVDGVISFLRVEGFLEFFVGIDVTKALARPYNRALYVHVPLCIFGICVALRRKDIDFIWLTLLVVSAELLIVITRFVFSYEQAFMGDLVRFWYAALFLFSSAYTLRTDQHVRVDVVYSTLSQCSRNKVDAIGAVLIGMLFCWTILLLGMWTKSSILIAPILGFEVSQSSFGMYVKYMMAGFLLIFAISMMLQFASALLENVAEYRKRYQV